MTYFGVSTKGKYTVTTDSSKYLPTLSSITCFAKASDVFIRKLISGSRLSCGSSMMGVFRSTSKHEVLLRKYSVCLLN